MAVAALTAASKMSLSCWRRLRSAAGGGGGDQLLVAAAVAVALLATARPASGGPAAVLLERARFAVLVSTNSDETFFDSAKGRYGWCTSPVNGPAFTCRCAGAEKMPTCVELFSGMGCASPWDVACGNIPCIL